MAHIVKRVARGTTSKVSAYAGPKGELIQDIDKNVLVMQTGVAGGQPLANGNADGMVTDVYLTEYSTTAKSVGQLGPVTYINGNETSADSITIPGRYRMGGGGAPLQEGMGWPTILNFGDVLFLVDRWHDNIFQRYETGFTGTVVDNMSFERYSSDGGASWSQWKVVSAFRNANVNIYVAKDGSDSNTGLSPSSPVLTLDRAQQIASKIKTPSAITYRIGAGDWGNINLSQNYFSSRGITITNYTNNANDTFPHFTALYIIGCDDFIFGYIDADRIQLRNTYVAGQYAGLKFGNIDATNSFVRFFNPMVVKYVQGNTLPIFRSFNTIWEFFKDGSNSAEITLESGLTNSAFLYTYFGSNNAFYFSGNMPINGTFIGKKYNFNGFTEIDTSNFSFPSAIPGTDGAGNYSINGIPQQGVVLTSGSQEIAGNKTFGSDTYFNRNIISSYGSISSSMGYTPPSSVQYKSINFMDGKQQYGIITSQVQTNGSVIIKLAANKFLTSESDTAQECAILCNFEAGNLKTATFDVNRVIPNSDNVASLGLSNRRWSELYAGTGTINTSDERVKSSINTLPDSVLDAWGEVNFAQFQFKDAIEAKGTADARLHTGLVAQRILEVFQNHGLDATRYGLLCHDSWEAEDWDETIVDKEAVTETVKVVDKAAVFATRTVEISPAYTDEEGVQHPAETYEETYEVSPEESHDEERVVEPEVSHVVHHHRDAGDLYSLRYEEALCVEAAYQRRRADRMEARLAALEAKLA